MATEKLNISITAKDNASKTIKDLNKTSHNLGTTFRNVALGVAAVGVAVGTMAVSFAKQTAEYKQLEDSFNRTTKSMGIDADNLINKLKDVSKGTISNKDLVLSANRAMALGVGKDIEGMATLLEIARIKGQKMGLTTTQAFDNIVTGIGRASPLILDNLGITIKQTEAQELYAEQLGKAASELTEAEKKQALLNAVLVEGKKELQEAGEVALTDAERMQKLNASWDDMKLVLGEIALPLLAKVTDLLTDLIGWVNENQETFSAWGKKLGQIFNTVGDLLSELGRLWGLFIKEMEEKMQPFVEWIQRHWDEISSIFNLAWDGLLEAFSLFWELLKTSFEIGWALFSSPILAALKILEGDWGGAWAVIQNMFKTAWEGMLTILGTIGEKIWNVIKLLWDDIKEGVSDFKLFLTDAWRGLWNGLYDIVMGIIDKIKDAVLGMYNYIKGKVDAIINSLRNVIEYGNASDLFNIGAIPSLFAQGGLVPEYAANGRFFKPRGTDTIPAMLTPGELVLNRAQQRNLAGQLTGGIVINIQGNFVGTEEEAERVGDIIIERLKSHSAIIQD